MFKQRKSQLEVIIIVLFLLVLIAITPQQGLKSITGAYCQSNYDCPSGYYCNPDTTECKPILIEPPEPEPQQPIYLPTPTSSAEPITCEDFGYERCSSPDPYCPFGFRITEEVQDPTTCCKIGKCVPDTPCSPSTSIDRCRIYGSYVGSFCRIKVDEIYLSGSCRSIGAGTGADDVSCICECEKESKQCLADGITIAKCSIRGEWYTEKCFYQCQNNECILKSTEKQECSEGEDYCYVTEGKHYRKYCVNGKYQTEECSYHCETSLKDYHSRCIPKPATELEVVWMCKEGEKRCSNNIVEICKKDEYNVYHWKTDKPCKENEICENGECISKEKAEEYKKESEVPTSSLEECTDTDNGLNYEVKGTTIIENKKTIDKCANEILLCETYCSDFPENTIRILDYPCLISYKICYDGTCRSCIQNFKKLVPNLILIGEFKGKLKDENCVYFFMAFSSLPDKVKSKLKILKLVDEEKETGLFGTEKTTGTAFGNTITLVGQREIISTIKHETAHIFTFSQNPEIFEKFSSLTTKLIELKQSSISLLKKLEDLVKKLDELKKPKENRSTQQLKDELYKEWQLTTKKIRLLIQKTDTANKVIKKYEEQIERTPFIKEWLEAAGDVYYKRRGKWVSKYAKLDKNGFWIWKDGTKGPKYGCIRPYGCSDIQEDIATFVEEISFKQINRLYKILVTGEINQEEREIYQKKLDLLLKYGFITDEDYRSVTDPNYDQSKEEDRKCSSLI